MGSPTSGERLADQRERAVLLVRNNFRTDSRVRRAAETLRRLGFAPTVVAVTSTDSEPRIELIDGIQVIRLPVALPARIARLRTRVAGNASRQTGSAPQGSRRHRQRLLKRLYRVFVSWRYYAGALRCVRRIRPSIVQCNDYNTLWVGAGARYLYRAKVVYDAHELWADRNQRPEFRWWLLGCEAFLIRFAHATTTSSPGYSRLLAERYRVERPIVVRNVPDATRVTVAPAGPEGSLVYVGAVTTNRGLEQVIQALADVPEARLEIVGPGRDDYIGHLVRHAVTAGVSDRVRFVAPVPPNRLINHISGATAGIALIQPSCLSYRLCLPNKLFEYLTAGLPVVASDLPVMGGFVREHGVGIPTSPSDLQAIAASLRAVLDPEVNSELRRRVASVPISWDAEQEQLCAVYRDVLQR